MLRPEHTFCGVPFCDDPSTTTADVAVFGAPYTPGVASHAASGAGAQAIARLAGRRLTA